MDQSRKADIILQAIRQNRWLDITYLNLKNERTRFWIGIRDILPDRRMKVLMYKSNYRETQTTIIRYDKIEDASMIEATLNESDPDLYERARRYLGDLQDPDDDSSLGVLDYLKQCYLHDDDPDVTIYQMVKGIDMTVFDERSFIKLDEEQQSEINAIYDENGRSTSDHHGLWNLAISSIAIERSDKMYVVAYHSLRYDPESKRLFLSDDPVLNRAFTREGMIISLQEYIDIPIDDFAELIKRDMSAACEMLEHNKKPGDIISTRPNIFVQRYDFQIDLDSLISRMKRDHEQRKLSIPLKAFFGILTRGEYAEAVLPHEPPLFLLSDTSNIDQVRAVRAALRNPVTYLEGPPGTGKTKTIVDIILSQFLSGKTVLAVSGNNTPVDGIAKRMKIQTESVEIELPFLRLGNQQEIRATIAKIARIYKEYEEMENFSEVDLSTLYAEMPDKNEELSARLSSSEEKERLGEAIRIGVSAFDLNGDKKRRSAKKVERYVDSLRSRSAAISEVKNEELKSLIRPLGSSKGSLDVLAEIVRQHLHKLLDDRFAELKRIIECVDTSEQYKRFKTYIGSDDNLKNLLEVFPIILCTNISTDKLGSGASLFDLVIMDESSQCSITTALLPIARGDRLLLVGDPNQLRPVINVSPEAEESYRAEYHVSENYDYIRHSIYDAMILNDPISQRLMLSYHYRCGKKIIEFSNKRYYDSRLKTETSRKDGSLVFLDVPNANIIRRNCAFEEAREVVRYVKRHSDDDIMIITPFVNQKNLINDMLIQEGIDINRIRAGTIHSLQGSERSTIIFSLGISYRTAKRTYDWLENNKELINVAITRAKDKLVIAGDYQALDALSDSDDDLYQLVRYVKSNGTDVSIPPSKKVEIGSSNGSFSEDEFFKTMNQFCSVHRRFEIRRNVPLSEIFSDDSELKDSKQEFDAVLLDRGFFRTRPCYVFEVDGGEHVYDERRREADDRKMRICQSKNIKLIRIPNQYVMRYSEMITLMRNSQIKSHVDPDKHDHF